MTLLSSIYVSSTTTPPTSTPSTLPFHPSIYCGLCIRVVEEMNYTISISASTYMNIPSLPQKFRIDDPHRYRKRLHVYSDEFLTDLLDHTILDTMIQEYAVMEEGSLLVGRRHWRKLVKPQWLLGEGQLPAGSKLPEYWEKEITRTYNYINSEYHDQIITSFQSYSDSIQYDKEVEDISRLLHMVCSQVIQACPPSYTYPSNDLRPVKGDEFQLKFNEMIPEVKKDMDDIDNDDDDDIGHDILTDTSMNTHSNEL